MRDIIGWDDAPEVIELNVARPHAHSKKQWPPDYDSIYRWRFKTLTTIKTNPKMLESAKTYYSTRPAEFIMDWMDTYDPRVKTNKWMPFVFFEKQMEVVQFLESCEKDQENGLVEKCRDAGLTWICVAYTIWRFLFIPNDAVGWGSRKEALVDKIGDPDSIFEKFRLVLKRLPSVWLPKDFSVLKHATFMKIINPENGAVITGEGGRNIGRGGRKSIFFLDEAAHIEGAEEVEAALGDNTNVRIDISSVNGLGNVFHRRREHGVVWSPGLETVKGFVRIFIMDWSDHPNKTQEWYQIRKARYEREGMAHIFAQEVDRSYSAAVSNTIIPYEWIKASVNAHNEVPYMIGKCGGNWAAGLDVADEGIDRNALSMCEGIIWRYTSEWGERDPGITARRAIEQCRPYSGRIVTQYDCIGVGSAVKTEYNRLTQDEHVFEASDIPFVPWNAGAGVERPFDRIIPDDDESIMNKDFFENLIAQAWWSLRTRFYKTFKARTEGTVYKIEELISLDANMPLLDQLCKELAQPTRTQSGRLRMLVEKKPKGTRSPNLADSGVMMYYPLATNGNQVEVGSYGH